MGVLAGFTEVPAELGARIEGGDEAAVEAARRDADARRMDVDKAWDGIRHLLDQIDRQCVWSQLFEGNVPLGREGLGYLSPMWVQMISESFQGSNAALELGEVYDPERMTAWGVYPDSMWKRDGQSALSYLRENFVRMEAFFEEVAHQRNGILVEIG